MAHEVAPAQETTKTPEKVEISGIPSSRKALEQLHDIDLSVIYVQLEVGTRLAEKYADQGAAAEMFYISPEWWSDNISNNDPPGVFGGMAQSFDVSYPKFVAEQIQQLTGAHNVAIEEGGANDELTAVGSSAEEGFIDFEDSQDRLNQSYELLENLATALGEAEEHAQKFAEIVGFEATPEESEVFLTDLMEHVIEKYELNLTEAETASLMSHLKEVAGQDLGVTSEAGEPLDAVLLSGTREYLDAERVKEQVKDPETGLIELNYQAEDGTPITVFGTEHRYDVDDPEIIYLDKFVRSIPPDSKTVIILEGQYGNAQDLPEDPAEAIKVAGGEFGYMASLAKQQGVEFVPGEPDPHDTAEQILRERPDITRDDIALHYGLKTLEPLFREKKSLPVDEIAPYIHHSVGIAGDAGVGGWAEHPTSREEVLGLSEEQKTEIVAEMPDIVQKLNAQFEKLRPDVQLLDLQPDGTLRLLHDLGKQPVAWDPAPEVSGQSATVITEISRLDMLMRDRHTFRLIQRVLEQGQEPVVAVGNSHVTTLQPALDAAFQR